MSERKSHFSQVPEHTSPKIKGTVFLPEDKIILLNLRAKARRQSISEVIRELLVPQVSAINQAEPAQQERLLAESKQRIDKDYEKYFKTYYGQVEVPSQPYPFVGIRWRLPQELVRTCTNLARKGQMDSRDFLRDLLLQSMNR